MNRTQALKLPDGGVPDWELEVNEDELSNLKSPAERQGFVILQSLKQSRDKWLREIFPKFSSRGRGGKQPDVVPPPHTIYNRGRCALQIGPHTFTDTTVFEIHYRPLPVVVPQPTTFVYQPAPGNALSQAVHQSQALPVVAGAGGPSSVSPSFPSASPVPPSLITQVNTAATSNPTLSSLLQLAASAQATPDQLKSLGLLIQSLATPTTNVPTTTSLPSATTTNLSTLTMSAPTPQYQYQAIPKDFDIVIEFQDAPSDRWIFPRGPATCDFVSVSKDSGSFGDLTVSTIVPFPSTTPPQPPSTVEAGTSMEQPPKQVVEFHFKMASSFIWDTFSRWIGSGEKMEENRKILAAIEPPEQKFLAYRLPEGSQLTQIQNAALPSYTMKSIKPSTENGRPRRRPAPRKSTQDPPGSPTAKRRRQTQPKGQPQPPKITCFACGQANVPLIMGGRYCRPCVQGGRAGENSQGEKASVSNTMSQGDVQSLPKPVDPPAHSETTTLPDQVSPAESVAK